MRKNNKKDEFINGNVLMNLSERLSTLKYFNDNSESSFIHEVKLTFFKNL